MTELLTPSFRMQAHFVLETLAFIVGFRYFLYLRKRRGDVIAEPNRITIMIAAMLGALVFSRLVGALENPKALLEAPNLLLHIYASKTVLGGFLGAIWVVEITKRIIGERNSSGDLFTFPVMLALMIGRVGCFICGVNEPTHGIETDFWAGMDLGDGKARHPVALYEIGFLALLWVGIVQAEKRTALANGVRFKIFMIAYLIFRFALDFIKPKYEYIYGMGIIQITCLIGVLYYIAFEKMLKGSVQNEIEKGEAKS